MPRIYVRQNYLLYVCGGEHTLRPDPEELHDEFGMPK